MYQTVYTDAHSLHVQSTQDLGINIHFIFPVSFAESVEKAA